MANHARVEELSDSDPDEVDISALASQARPQSNATDPTLMQGAQVPAQRGNQITQEKSKHWQCLYPLYFDASRKRSEGRRVSTELAIPNPLAREIADAVWSLNLQPLLEPESMHPRDWSNPGRVRVLIKEDGKTVSRGVKNKHHLYLKVANYLKAHPTNEKSPSRLKIAGMPPSMESPAPPAIPRGWRMNNILPLHSPALSGGGVSDNLFKEMMAEMQGDQGGSVPAGGKSKKEKKIKG